MIVTTPAPKLVNCLMYHAGRHLTLKQSNSGSVIIGELGQQVYHVRVIRLLWPTVLREISGWLERLYQELAT